MMPILPQWANTQAGKPLRLQAQYQSPGGGWGKGTGQVRPLIAPRLSLSPTWALNTKEMKEGVGTVCSGDRPHPMALCRPTVQSLA